MGKKAINVKKRMWKRAGKIFGKMILAGVLGAFVYFSLTMIFTSMGTSIIGEQVYEQVTENGSTSWVLVETKYYSNDRLNRGDGCDRLYRQHRLNGCDHGYVCDRLDHCVDHHNDNNADYASADLFRNVRRSYDHIQRRHNGMYAVAARLYVLQRYVDTGRQGQ